MQPGLAFCLPGTSINIIPRVAAYRKKGRYTIAIIQPAEAKTATIYRRIGSTTYKVRVHFSDTAKETINDKILHLIQHEAVTNAADCGTMGLPQMTQPLEGSSL
ncbi:MAG: transposon-encoded TnpW family protein [Oscillospiraceae bacterium]|nr:transposon-encoded TnpW family protein [Oscillospiraceae bacterium]